MSLHEEIAHLTGTLSFNVNSTGLQQFSKMMQDASKRLSTFIKEYEQLSKAMSKPLKLKLDTSELEKARKKLETLQPKATKANAAVAIQQHANDKLKAPGSKASPSTVAASDAALAKAQAAKARVDKQVAAAQSQLLKNQATAAGIMQKAQAHAANMSHKAQTLGQQIATATTSGQQKAARHNAALTTAANRHTLQSLQIQHQQTKNAKQSSGGYRSYRSGGHGGMASFFGHGGGHNIHAIASGLANIGNTTSSFGTVLSGLTNAISPATLALGGFGLAVGAATGLLGALHDRVEAREHSTADSEQFGFALQASGDDTETQKKARAGYLKASLDYANPINTETAKEYVKQFRAMTSKGYSDDATVKFLDNAAAVKRAANITGIDNTMFDRETRNALSKGKLDSRQSMAVLSHLGAVSGMFEMGVAKSRGYKGDESGASKYLNKDHHAQFTAKDLIAGYDFVANNTRAVQERHAGSIENSEITLQNQKFLQRVDQETNPELIAVIHDRINAEQELNKAMAPLQQTLLNFDIALTKAETGLLHWAAGLNLDGTKKTEDQKAIEAATAGQNIEAPSIDPNALTGSQAWPNDPTELQKQLKKASDQDPVNRLFNFMFGKKPDTPALGTPSVPELDIGSPLFNSTNDKNLNYQPKQSKMPTLYDTFSAMQSAMSDSGSIETIAKTSQVFNTPITINNTNNLNTTIAGSATAADGAKFVDHVEAHLANVLPERVAGLTKGAVNDMLGAARAQQAERQ
jgi:hypothetical protein